MNARSRMAECCAVMSKYIYAIASVNNVVESHQSNNLEGTSLGCIDGDCAEIDLVLGAGM